jgi:hypothetical protein
MCGAIPSLPQYAFMAWYSVKAQGQLYIYLYLNISVSELTEGLSFSWVILRDIYSNFVASRLVCANDNSLRENKYPNGRH